jgi:hypothetical protein
MARTSSEAQAARCRDLGFSLAARTKSAAEHASIHTDSARTAKLWKLWLSVDVEAIHVARVFSDSSA